MLDPRNVLPQPPIEAGISHHNSSLLVMLLVFALSGSVSGRAGTGWVALSLWCACCPSQPCSFSSLHPFPSLRFESFEGHSKLLGMPERCPQCKYHKFQLTFQRSINTPFRRMHHVFTLQLHILWLISIEVFPICPVASSIHPCILQPCLGR